MRRRQPAGKSTVTATWGARAADRNCRINRWPPKSGTMSGIFRRPLNQPWFVKFEIVDVRPDRVSDLTLPDALSGTGLSSNEKILWSASLR